MVVRCKYQNNRKYVKGQDLYIFYESHEPNNNYAYTGT